MIETIFGKISIHAHVLVKVTPEMVITKGFMTHTAAHH